jgi:hypothetical protein
MSASTDSSEAMRLFLELPFAEYDYEVQWRLEKLQSLATLMKSRIMELSLKKKILSDVIKEMCRDQKTLYQEVVLLSNENRILRQLCQAKTDQ